MFFHNAVNTVDANGVALAVFQISPDATIAPEGVVGFDGHDQGQEFLITLLSGEGSAASHSS